MLVLGPLVGNLDGIIAGKGGSAMKMLASVVLAIFLMILTSNPALSSNLSKAKDFMKAGMYPQAIALLEKEVNDNPTNAEAHFQLGNAYSTKGRLT